METVLAEGRERTLLSGNAELISEDTHIRADRIELFGEDFVFALSSGQVRVVNIRQGIELTSDTLFYDRKARVVRIQGNAVLVDRENEVVAKVQQRVLEGMGLIVLHSGHWSKIFTRLMGTRCTLRWREGDDREVVWNVAPSHPIARGVEPGFVLERHEMYGEFFDIPAPDELVFISSFSGGEVFRSGCCFQRGKGRIFYFSPGHETYPIYYHSEVKKVLANAVVWAYEPSPSAVDTTTCVHAPEGWYLDSSANAGEQGGDAE